MKVKIRKGDTVEVISGTDKSKRGEVIRVLSDGKRVVVQGVNVRKKHQKQTQLQSGRTYSSGIIEFESSIDISNLKLVCPSCKESTRVGLRREGDQSLRVCKACGTVIEG